MNHYLKFPLACLRVIRGGRETDASKSAVFEDILACGIMNAGTGYKETHGVEAFTEKLNSLECDTGGMTQDVKTAIVGASVCGVGQPPIDVIERYIETHKEYKCDAVAFPLVSMRLRWIDSARSQARFDDELSNYDPSGGIGWDEFRILCAILSARKTRGFSFIGWETIQALSCGMLKRDYVKEGRVTPRQLAPPLQKNKISRITKRLNREGFYARESYSRGEGGGWTAYSFKMSANELKTELVAHRKRQTGEVVAVQVNKPKPLRSLPEPVTGGISWSKNGGFTGITDDDRKGWKEAYPDVTAEQALEVMNQWLLANPDKANRSNWKRFIVGWLSRNQGEITTAKHTPQQESFEVQNARQKKETYQNNLKNMLW